MNTPNEVMARCEPRFHALTQFDKDARRQQLASQLLCKRASALARDWQEENYHRFQNDLRMQKESFAPSSHVLDDVFPGVQLPTASKSPEDSVDGDRVNEVFNIVRNVARNHLSLMASAARFTVLEGDIRKIQNEQDRAFNLWVPTSRAPRPQALTNSDPVGSQPLAHNLSVYQAQPQPPNTSGQIPHDDPENDAAFAMARMREALMWDLPFKDEDDNGAVSMIAERFVGEEEPEAEHYETAIPEESFFEASERLASVDHDLEEMSNSSEFEGAPHTGVLGMIIGAGIGLLAVVFSLVPSLHPSTIWSAFVSSAATSRPRTTIRDLIDCTEGMGPGPRDCTACLICYEAIGPVTATITHGGCQRTYCSACLFDWVDEQRRCGQRATCPMDRKPIVPEVAGTKLPDLPPRYRR